MARWSLFIGSIAASILVSFAGAAAEPIVHTYDPLSPEQSCPNRSLCDDWLIFRSANPWPYQTTAIAMHNQEAVIVLSEPPPSVSRDELVATVSGLFGDDLVQTAFMRWPTGADGWLEDLVIRVKVNDTRLQEIMSQDLRPRQVPAAIVEPLRALQYAQYGTSDGVWFDEIGPRTAPAAVREIRATTADLRAWLGPAQGRWVSVSNSSEGRTLSEISALKMPSVFRRVDGQLVLLLLPKGRDPLLAAAFRRFAVESDLLLGATDAKNGSLLLVGRSRRLAMDVLPPLRFETYAAFAAAPDPELAQSYERRRIFAGKVRDGRFKGFDWAPILLSSQLQDGEMGTLLNIADEILKSRSQRGAVRYYPFARSKPETYPPFENMAASEYFFTKFKTTSLRFNWNTEDFATILDAPERSYLAVDRTGALPILYEPTEVLTSIGDGGREGLLDQLQKLAQDDAIDRAISAREHFIDAGDPVLARVVQNIILFQAIQSFGSPTGPRAAPASRSERVTAQLQLEAQRWVSGLARNDWADVEPKARDAVKAYLSRSGTTAQQLARAIANPQDTENDLMRRRKALRRSIVRRESLRDRAISLWDEYDKLYEANCTRLRGTRTAKHCEYSKTAAAEASWRPVKDKGEEAKKAEGEANTALTQSKAEMARLARDEANFGQALELGEILAAQSHDAALDGILERVLVAAQDIPNPGSIRTPSVVLSQNTVELEAVGGHSVSLKAGRAKINAGVKAPRMVPSADGATLLVPPERAADVEALLHPGTGGVNAGSAPTRPIDDVLGRAPPGSMIEIMSRAKVSESQLARTADLLKSCDCDAVVRQASDGSLTLARRGPPVATIGLYGKDAVIEQLLLPPSPKFVMLEGISPESAGHIGKSVLEAQAASGGRRTFLSGVADLLRGPRPTDPQVILLTKVGNRLEPLKIWGDHTALRKIVDWRGSQVEPATGEAWSRTFAGEQLAGGDQAVLLRLGTGPDSEIVGIRARGAAVGAGQQLLAACRAWLLKRVKPAPVDESLVSLRNDLRNALPNEGEFEYFYNNNAKTIRAADADLDLAGVPAGR